MDDADLRVRVLALRDAMGAATVDRADAVEALVLGLVCQEHVLFLGPPGTGKSYLTRLLTKSIAGAAYFETLLTKFSTEDEVCGAIDIAALRAHNVVRRNTAGMLPSSDVAFVDETFKLGLIPSALNPRCGRHLDFSTLRFDALSSILRRPHEHYVRRLGGHGKSHGGEQFIHFLLSVTRLEGAVLLTKPGDMNGLARHT